MTTPEFNESLRTCSVMCPMKELPHRVTQSKVVNWPSSNAVTDHNQQLASLHWWHHHMTLWRSVQPLYIYIYILYIYIYIYIYMCTILLLFVLFAARIKAQRICYCF